MSLHFLTAPVSADAAAAAAGGAPGAAGARRGATVPARSPQPAGGLAALLAALLLAGCASPGPAHTPLALTLPAALGLAALDTADARGTPGARAGALPAEQHWWTTLGDPQLDALVERALQGNPGLDVARARQARALALVEGSRSASGPRGSLAADATRQRYSANGLVPPPIAGSTRTSASLQASLEWSPDFFGRNAAALAASIGQARAAQAESAAAAQALALQVSRAYVALARLVAQHGVAERQLAQRQSLLQLTQERTTAGLDSQVELTQAQAALPDARTQIEALEEQMVLARRLLAVLCGQAPEALAALSPRLEQLALADMPGQLGTNLLGRRPDVVAARWRVEAAMQEVAVARTEFYPDIHLGAFVGLNALGLGNLVSAGSRQMGVAPALRLPLFDGQRLRAQLAGRQAELDTAIAQYNGAVLDAVRGAGDAMASVQSVARQQALQAEALAKAEAAYDFAVQRYRAGLANQLVVLNTESQVLAQRRARVDLHSRALDTRAVLLNALGGGWDDGGADTPVRGLQGSAGSSTGASASASAVPATGLWPPAPAPTRAAALAAPVAPLP